MLRLSFGCSVAKVGTQNEEMSFFFVYVHLFSLVSCNPRFGDVTDITAAQSYSNKDITEFALRLHTQYIKLFPEYYIYIYMQYS